MPTVPCGSGDVVVIDNGVAGTVTSQLTGYVAGLPAALCVTVSVPAVLLATASAQVTVNVCVLLPTGMVNGVAAPLTEICGPPVVEKFEMIRLSRPVLEIVTVAVIDIVVNAAIMMVDTGTGVDA